MSPYTERDLRDALHAEATGAPAPPDVWPAVRRRHVRRRTRIRAGAALLTAAVVAVGLADALPEHARHSDQPTALQPASYEQACAVEPNVCAPGVSGPIPTVLGRPLHLPTVRPGDTCPVTSGEEAANGYVFGLQFGHGPVAMIIGNRGQPNRGTVDLGTTEVSGWFALENVWLAGLQYQGPFIVRGQRLDAPGPVAFGGAPTSPTFVEPPAPDPNTNGPYRTPPGTIWLKTPGCYGFQIDGLSFTETIVIDALPPKRP